MKHYSFVLEVPSESNPNKGYDVKMDEQGNLTCPCKSWINNTRHETPRSCKHTDIIKWAGWSGETGKFLVRIDNHQIKSLLFCKNYPDSCEECKLRFVCWTEKQPEFNVGDLRAEGIL